MSGFEEETYSTIFTSLKHPVRRKVLRMLSEKPRNFSEILDALGISSSHLTYHLENLGELVSKTENGKYKLSTFGEAAVGTMSKVEEAPKATKPERLSLSMRARAGVLCAILGITLLIGGYVAFWYEVSEGGAFYSYKFWSMNPYRYLAFPLIVLGVILIIAGAFLYFYTPKETQRLESMNSSS